MSNATAWAGAESTIKYGIYLGVWTNWSRGRIIGATLTLNRTDGNYILTFTSLFITIVSACFWSIVKLVMHRCYSTSGPRDALHHQELAVLRNYSSAFDSLQVLCSLAWAWRNTVNGKRCLLRLVPGIVTAAFVAVAFGIASGFSSQISSGIGDHVLLDGTNCSIVNYANTDDHAYVLYPYYSRITLDDANYAQQCYSDETSGMFDCTTFVKARLPSTIDTRASCPFASHLCRSNNANIRLDTGYLDSNDDLGINAPQDERIKFRIVMSCAPLSTEGYSRNTSTIMGNYTTYDYGNTTLGQNYTYEIRSLQTQYATGRIDKFATSILASFAEANFNGTTFVGSSDFQSTPGLFPRDGDLTISFLSGNGIVFERPMDDLWYRATILETNNYSTAGLRKVIQAYQPEEAASPIACFQQYQFCDASVSRCGPLSSWMDAQTGAASLFNTTAEALETNESPPGDNAAASRYIWFVALVTMSVPSFTSVLDQLGVSSLVSTHSLSSGLMGPLPDNQWQIDVTNWWATFLAAIQTGVVSTSYGPTDSSVQSALIKPFNDWIRDHMCNNQLILSSDFTSFSLFGLYLTYILGLIIIIICLSLEPILAALCRHRGRGEYACLEWNATGILQLQRMAFQGVKSGTWSGYRRNVPTTLSEDIMANLPFEYSIDQESSENFIKGPGKTTPAISTAPTLKISASCGLPEGQIETLQASTNSTVAGNISGVISSPKTAGLSPNAARSASGQQSADSQNVPAPPVASTSCRTAA